MTIPTVAYGAPASSAWANAVAAALDATAWTTPSFTSSWVNEGSAGVQVAQYRRIGDIVYVRGLIKGGASGSSAFTLPSGFRPPAHLHFASSSGATFAIVIVSSTGTVSPSGAAVTSLVAINLSFSVTA